MIVLFGKNKLDVIFLGKVESRWYNSFTISIEYIHYEKKLTKNIRPTDILQIYTSI